MLHIVRDKERERRVAFLLANSLSPPLLRCRKKKIIKRKCSRNADQWEELLSDHELIRSHILAISQ